MLHYFLLFVVVVVNTAYGRCSTRGRGRVFCFFVVVSLDAWIPWVYHILNYFGGTTEVGFVMIQRKKKKCSVC